MRTLSGLLAVLALALGAAVAAQLVLRAQTGPLPIVAVLETHLLAVASVASVLGLPSVLGRGWVRTRGGSRGGSRGRSAARLGLVGVVVLAVVRLGGELWSPPRPTAAEGAQDLVVLSWNLEDGSRGPEASVAGILAVDADVVALQELVPSVAEALESDPRITDRYPYRILEPADGVDGMGLLARRPLLVRGSQADPLVLRAGLLLGGGTTLELLDVHPYPPRIDRLGPVPVGLDTRRRDEDLSVIAGMLEALAEPELALVIGDLNAAPAEPGFAPLAGALTDAHALAGSGPGFTWRPSSLEGLGVGAVRIDHVLSGSRLEPRTVTEDCSLPGDHCRLVVRLLVLPAPGRPIGEG